MDSLRDTGTVEGEELASCGRLEESEEDVAEKTSSMTGSRRVEDSNETVGSCTKVLRVEEEEISS